MLEIKKMPLGNSAKGIVQNDFGGPAIMSRSLGFRPVALRPRLSTGLPFRSLSLVPVVCIIYAKMPSGIAAHKILPMILACYHVYGEDDGWKNDSD
jgi:hypothetical protein